MGRSVWSDADLQEDKTMITFFTIPKPFIGHIGIIQRNALRSWRAIPNSEIILFGNEAGVGQEAKEFGAIHIPHVSMSPYGTPYLDDIFHQAQMQASNDIVCYVNADIILYNSLQTAINKTLGQEFLMTGMRWDVDVPDPINPLSMNFLKYLHQNYKPQTLYPGMDWFAFPKFMIDELPRFIVGRRGWDNWMVYHCRSRDIRVIDASDMVITVHQNHDYTHIPETQGERWENCPESDYNLNLIKSRIIYRWELEDATHEFYQGELVKKPLSIRQLTQGLILQTPESLHGLINPIYRCGHIVNYLAQRLWK
jgi:hypothetical protein